MNKNKTYILVAVLIVLIIAAYFLTTDRGPKTETEKTPPKDKEFFTVDSANVDKIEIVRKNGKVVLQKIAGAWRQTEPVDYLVNATFVPPAVGDLKNFALSSTVSNNPSKADTYGFNDTNKTTITVFEKGVQKGVIVVGNAGQGPSQTFIKRPDKNTIYLAENFLRMNFVKDNIDDWRDKLIASIPSGSVKSIDFSYPDEAFKITKDTSNRFFMGKDSIQYSAMEGYLNLLQNMNTQGFSSAPLDTVKKFTSVIKVDADKPYEFDLLKVNADPVYYLMRVSGNKQVFKFDENLAKMILKPKKEFLGK
ncbi:MAG: DUF4340 domain-containing protein [Ignavibacteria bacterium]|nr:DUF4340 domain-containing protein [Ignavibacteria bacterium]